MRYHPLLIAATGLLASTASASATGYPIKDFPDYNATYLGVPDTGDLYTGDFLFSTLYRDNYCRGTGARPKPGDQTKCEGEAPPGSVNMAGEGTGKHPGVDIRGTTGMHVRATMVGKVVFAGCRGHGFGNVIIIEADNPYESDKVYISFAHLSVVSVSKGDVITDPGMEVGLSGGTTYNCDIQSVPHLHFQVDKPHHASDVFDNVCQTTPADCPYPWYPFGRVEVADRPSDPDFVMKFTYNPLVFVKGRQVWTFNEANFLFKEFWVPTDVNSSGVSGGALWLDSSSRYAAIARGPTVMTCSAPLPAAPCSTQLSVDTTVTPNLHMRAHFKCINNPATVSVQRSNGSWATSNFNYQKGTALYSVSLDDLALSDNIVTNIRINPSQGCTATTDTREYYFLKIWLAR